MPPEMNVWRTVGMISVFFGIYLLFRLFGMYLEDLEGKLFKKCRTYLLLNAVIAEFYIIFIAVALTKMRLEECSNGLAYGLVTIQMIPFAILMSVIVATIDKWFPDGIIGYVASIIDRRL